MGIFTVGGILTDWIGRAWHGLWISIDTLVYNLIAIVYRIFFLVSEANIFDFNNPDTFGQITKNIYVILGVAMVFVLAYNIIRLIITPDKMNDTSDGSSLGLIKNTLISLVAIVLLPTIFNFMYQIQHDVIESDIIGNVLLGGTSIMKSGQTNIKTAGTEVALNIISAFYHPLGEEVIEDADGNVVRTGNIVALSLKDCFVHGNVNEGIDKDLPICETYVEAWNKALNSGRPGILIGNPKLFEGVDEDMEYLYIFSTIAGIIALYLFLSFSLDLGVRAAKLAILQLIAPIPIILRVTKPSGGVFSKWFKEIKDTYLMVFIRIAIIYFAVFTIEVIINSLGGNIFALFSTVSGDGSVSGLTIILANAIVFLGILQFAKDAPKLIENLIGSNGKIKWKIKDKLNENEYAKRAVVGVGATGINMGRRIGNGITEIKNRNVGSGLLSIGGALNPFRNLVTFGRGVSQGNVDLSGRWTDMPNTLGGAMSMASVSSGNSRVSSRHAKAAGGIEKEVNSLLDNFKNKEYRTIEANQENDLKYERDHLHERKSAIIQAIDDARTDAQLVQSQFAQVQTEWAHAQEVYDATVKNYDTQRQQIMNRNYTGTPEQINQQRNNDLANLQDQLNQAQNEFQQKNEQYNSVKQRLSEASRKYQALLNSQALDIARAEKDYEDNIQNIKDEAKRKKNDKLAENMRKDPEVIRQFAENRRQFFERELSQLSREQQERIIIDSGFTSGRIDEVLDVLRTPDALDSSGDYVLNGDFIGKLDKIKTNAGKVKRASELSTMPGFEPTNRGAGKK